MVGVALNQFAPNGRFYPVRRRDMNVNAFFRKQRKNPTLWIGGLMFCLALAYLGVVVVVTIGHNAPLEAETAKVENVDVPAKTSLRETIRKAKEKNDQGKRKGNPVRKHHLELELGAGVDPLTLMEHDEKDAPIAVKVDPPVNEHPTPDTILTSYLEPLNYDDWEILPLPVREKAKADQLKKVTYSRLSSCAKLPQQWPTDDTPTDEDPFLPWIHDVFPTADGKYIQFVAQNKRRCKTGSKETDILAHMGPQASLFQHVSVKRVQAEGGTRYRLASHEEADGDAIATRFICRFKPSLEETFSEYNFDYDWVAFRKRYRVSFAEDDGGIKQIHTSQLTFRCPVPPALQEVVRTGSSVKDDWASLFVDLIPIRTAPRWGSPRVYLTPAYEEFGEENPENRFDPIKAWGKNHILPRIEDSGRWENIPICKPSLMTYEHDDSPAAAIVPVSDGKVPKRHRLVSCIWASAGYTTRGNRFAVNDGQRRLLEWIQHNSIIGFDHFYLYDNSGAFGASTSLKPIADLFPDRVTYVPWPAQICNNNPNNVDSPGERSSQYAAESSCRLRFGPHVKWIGQFDVDEYLIPMGDHNNITSLLDELEEEDTRIVSFNSWRAWPRWKFVEEPVPIDDPDTCWSKEPCFDLKVPLKYTMLQAYNCDRQKPGQKTSTMPAEKQIYKADYVLQHFVHYSAVTALSAKNKTEYEKEGVKWSHRPFPDHRQRFADEVKEGLMIHSKAVARQDTAGWKRVCSLENQMGPKNKRGLCRLGVPWPDDEEEAMKNATEDGWAFNCFVNEKVEQLYVPLLDAQLKQYEHLFEVKSE